MRGISMMGFIRFFCQVLFLSTLVSSVNGQTSRYSRVRPNYQYTSPYNTDIIQGAMMYKQQQADRNINLIYDKNDEINETLDNVYANIGGFSEDQLKIISKYFDDINNRCKGDMSDNGYVRGIISVMNSWNRYFKSWEKEYNQSSSNTIYFDTSIPIWNSPYANGKLLGWYRGNIKVIGKIKDTDYYKVERNSQEGYVHEFYIKEKEK